MNQNNTFNLEEWMVEGFKNTDTDIVTNALEELNQYLDTVDEFTEIGQNNTFYVELIINSILKNEQNLSHIGQIATFNQFIDLIPRFAAKLPVDYLPVFYDTLFQNLMHPRYNFFSIVANVVEDTISSSINYNLSRQKTIASCFMNRLPPFISNNQNSTDFRNLSLTLLSLTVENLPHCLTPENVKELKTIINDLCKQLSSRTDVESIDYLKLSQTLFSISKVFSTLVTGKEQEEFFDSIEELENSRLKILIFSNIIQYRPQFFALNELKDQKYSYLHYMDLILEQISNPSDVQNYDTPYITFVVQCLGALTVFVRKFATSEGMTNDQILDYINAATDFLELGISVDEIDEDEEEEDEDDEETLFGTRVNRGDEDEKDTFDDNIVVSENDTWQVRIAAMKLSTALIEKKGDIFYDQVIALDENDQTPGFIENLIIDTDNNCKLQVPAFLRTIVHHYKSTLDKKISEKWEGLIISQLKSSNRALDLYINILATMIKELHTELPLDLANDAISSIQNVFQDDLVDPVLFFISAFLESTKKVEIVEPVIDLMSTLLEEAPSKSKAAVLAIISDVYYYYHKNCNNEASLHESLNDLNEQILALVDEALDYKPSAISTISVFVSCCPDLQSSQKSIELISSYLSNSYLALSSVSGVSLISASKSGKSLSPKAAEILAKLIENLSKNPAITNQCLWAIIIMLDKQILSPSNFENLGPIFDILSKGELNSRLLCLRILNRVYQNGADSKAFEPLIDCLTNSALNRKIIIEMADFVLSSSKASFDNVKSFVDSLIEKIRSKFTSTDNSSISPIIANVAFIIGIASSTNNDYKLSLISSFKSQINENGFARSFALRCIGEIGSYIDLSSSFGDLVDSIFKLIEENDRTIFVPAAESIGLMSIGSLDVILKRLVSAANSSESLTSYLFAIRSFVRKASTNKKYISPDTFEKIKACIPIITEYLLKNSKDDFSDAATTVSECLAMLISISFEFINTLINEATYITIRAIFTYFEEYSPYGYERNLTNDEKEKIVQIITDVNDKYDYDKPMLDYAIMLCIKFALSKNLERELFDANVVERIIEGIQEQPSHIITRRIGLKTETVNIGVPIRSTSLTCLEIVLKSEIANDLDSDESAVQYSDIIEQLYHALINSSEELQIKVLDILAFLARSPYQDNIIKTDIVYQYDDGEDGNTNIVECFIKFDKDVIQSKKTIPSNEIKIADFNALLALLAMESLSELVNAEFKRKLNKLMVTHKDDQTLIKLREDLALDKSKSDASYLTNGYTYSRLLEEIYPDASSIFSNLI